MNERIAARRIQLIGFRDLSKPERPHLRRGTCCPVLGERVAAARSRR